MVRIQKKVFRVKIYRLTTQNDLEMSSRRNGGFILQLMTVEMETGVLVCQVTHTHTHTHTGGRGTAGRSEQAVVTKWACLGCGLPRRSDDPRQRGALAAPAPTSYRALGDST